MHVGVALGDRLRAKATSRSRSGTLLEQASSRVRVELILYKRGRYAVAVALGRVGLAVGSVHRLVAGVHVADEVSNDPLQGSGNAGSLGVSTNRLV